MATKYQQTFHRNFEQRAPRAEISQIPTSDLWRGRCYLVLSIRSVREPTQTQVAGIREEGVARAAEDKALLQMEGKM